MSEGSTLRWKVSFSHSPFCSVCSCMYGCFVVCLSSGTFFWLTIRTSCLVSSRCQRKDLLRNKNITSKSSCPKNVNGGRRALRYVQEVKLVMTQTLTNRTLSFTLPPLERPSDLVTSGAFRPSRPITVRLQKWKTLDPNSHETTHAGGGAFFVPYLMALFLIGIPLLILEISLGQYYQTGDVGVFGSFHRRWRGVGVSSVACTYSY